VASLVSPVIGLWIGTFRPASLQNIFFSFMLLAHDNIKMLGPLTVMGNRTVCIGTHRVGFPGEPYFVYCDVTII